jgi:hypothetical protein
MEKLDLRALMLSGAIFAGGVYFLVTDLDVWFGLAATLIGGAFALFAGLPLLRSRSAPVRIGTLDGEPSFVLDVARSKEIAVQVGLLCLVSGSAVMVLDGSGRAWISLVCGAGLALWWSWRVIRGGRAITLTPTRVVLTVDDREVIPWAEVDRVHLYDDSDDTPNLLIAGEDVQIDQFVASSKEVGRIVTLYFEDPARRAAIGTEAELARVI